MVKIDKMEWDHCPEEEVQFFLQEMHKMSEHLVTEPKLPEMDRKLIINIAPNGATISHLENPDIPCEPEKIIEDVIECYEAGASVWHTHIRVDKMRSHSFDNYLKCFDTVAKYCPDLIYSFTAVADFKYMDHRLFQPLLDDLVAARGKQYCEMILLSPVTYSCGDFFYQPCTETAAIDQVQYCQQLGLKPEIQVRNLDHLARFKRFLIDSGVMTGKYVMNLCAGTHDSAPTGPNPWGFMNVLMMYQSFMDIPREKLCLGMVAGERNWLPITTLGIMLGVDSVRIGAEEPVYMYPHKDEKIVRNVDCVNKIKSIANELGREIATPAEAREIMGMEPPTWC